MAADSTSVTLSSSRLSGGMAQAAWRDVEMLCRKPEGGRGGGVQVVHCTVGGACLSASRQVRAVHAVYGVCYDVRCGPHVLGGNGTNS